MKKKAAIILSRLDSKRFPEKALYNIQGKSLLEWCISSIYPNNNRFDVILATTNRAVDDPLEVLAKKNNIKCFRGDTENVAKRILDCAEHYNIDIFARVNGDSPFIIVDLLEKGFYEVEFNDFDFATNLFPRSFPYGISVEVFKTDIFREAYKNINSKNNQEHVTPYFYENISNYNPYFIKSTTNNHDIRLVVDKIEDTLIISNIISALSNSRKINLEELIETYKKIKK